MLRRFQTTLYHPSLICTSTPLLWVIPMGQQRTYSCVFRATLVSSQTSSPLLMRRFTSLPVHRSQFLHYLTLISGTQNIGGTATVAIDRLRPASGTRVRRQERWSISETQITWDNLMETSVMTCTDIEALRIWHWPMKSWSWSEGDAATCSLAMMRLKSDMNQDDKQSGHARLTGDWHGRTICYGISVTKRLISVNCLEERKERIALSLIRQTAPITTSMPLLVMLKRCGAHGARLHFTRNCVGMAVNFAGGMNVSHSHANWAVHKCYIGPARHVYSWCTRFRIDFSMFASSLTILTLNLYTVFSFPKRVCSFRCELFFTALRPLSALSSSTFHQSYHCINHN